MPNRLNNWLKAFLSLSKSEQRGIIILTVLILILGISNLLLPYFVNSKAENNIEKYRTEIDSFLNEQKLLSDSAHYVEMQNSGKLDITTAKKKIHPTVFDPNNLPVEDWKKMGFTDKQIRTIKNYEAKGGSFKKKEDLKKIYSISDAEYSILEPYIVIRSSNKTKTRKSVNKKSSTKNVALKTTEINSADSIILVSSLGFSPWLAKRTISYRYILGGYNNKEQLNEVYGLNDSIYTVINKYIVIDTGLITRIDINKIGFKDLLKHPYFDYNTTKSIMNTRNRIGSFTSISQLDLIEGISDTTLIKIRDYLYFRPLN